MLRPLLLLLTPALATLALSSTASAATYCVHQPGDPCPPASTDLGGDLQGALTAAKDTLDADTVALGAGTWSGTFSYQGASPLDLRGSGPATILTKPAAAFTTVLYGGSAHVSDLAVLLPAANGVRAIVASQGVVDRVTVSGPAAGASIGLTLIGSAASHVDVDLGSEVGTAAELYGPSTLTDSRLVANTGVYRFAGPGGSVARVQRVTVDTMGNGLFDGMGALDADDVVIRFRLGATAALAAANCGTTVTADHLTILSTDGTGTALEAECGSAGVGASLTVTNSIVRGGTQSAYRHAYNGGTADVHVSSTAITAASAVQTGAGTLSFGADDLAGVDPLFAAAPADLHLAAGSPALDVGTPSAATLDVEGNPRVSGSASDLGAYERQVAAVPVGGGETPAGPSLPPVDPGLPQAPGPVGGAPAAPRQQPVVIGSLALRLRAHRVTASFTVNQPVTVRVGWERRRGRGWTSSRHLTRRVPAGRTSVRLPARLARGVYRVRVSSGWCVVTRTIRVR